MNTAIHFDIHLNDATRDMDLLAQAADALVKISVDDAAAAVAEDLYLATRRLYRDYVRRTSERAFAGNCVSSAAAALERAFVASRDRIDGAGLDDWRMQLAWSAVSQSCSRVLQRFES